MARQVSKSTTRLAGRWRIVQVSGWDGADEGDQVSGRGWAVPVDDEAIEGHLFFRMGDDSSIRAEPFTGLGDLDRR